MPLEFMDMLAKPTLGFSQALLSNANSESVLNRRVVSIESRRGIPYRDTRAFSDPLEVLEGPTRLA